MTVQPEKSGPNVGLVKIAAAVPPEAGWEGMDSECLWGEPMGSGTYLLKNVPFFIDNVSWGDCVSAVEREGVLYFVRVVARGGHSTFRIAAKLGRFHPPVLERLDKLVREHKCLIEGVTDRLVALSVPPSADLEDVGTILEECEARGLWDFDVARLYQEEEKGDSS